METKPRLSFDDCGSAASSALRRITHNPSQRLTLRRTSTPSSTATTLSSPTAIEVPVSCVTRDTARDECGLHRFIVWAAVKRNACRNMTAEERRECPLLRCRKRFPNHELMLQHLYTCDQLAAAEYWCYECQKVERFNDVKCRQCLGHPSKRRKIMSMAKNFFSSLGHKTRTGHLHDDDLDMDDAPPSYDSILAPSQPELSSNEIHEIDSSEVSVSAPILPEATTTTDYTITGAETDTLMEPVSPLHHNPIVPVPIHLAELESVPSSVEEALIDWDPSPTPPSVELKEAFLLRSQTNSPERPVLQLHTHDLEQYRAQAKRRSKKLAPSTSVRSNCSSTSANSTLSTASYDVTPMSAWSGAWASGPGFDSTLTSPDDLVSTADLFPVSLLDTAAKMDKEKGTYLFQGAVDSLPSELPADIPFVHSLPDSCIVPGSLDMNQSVFSFNTSVPTELSIESNLALTGPSDLPLDISELLVESPWSHYANANALVGSVRDALQLHIDESLAKLKQVGGSIIAGQFRMMMPDSIALTGLRTLSSISDGSKVASAIDLLCFVHLVFSLSLVVHEQDAPTRCRDLYMQAMSYSSWLPREELADYCLIVEILWKPHGTEDEELGAMLDTQGLGASLPTMSEKVKGKQPQVSPQRSDSDALLFVGQHFLDELEYAALQEVDRPEIQASELSIQHLKDVSLVAHNGSPFSVAVNFMLRYLYQQFSEASNYAATLKELMNRANSGYITARRLELELMHAGRKCLPSRMFFDYYIPTVRTQMDSLYSQADARLNPRSTYYRQGVRLIEAIIHGPITGPAFWETEPPTGPVFDSLDFFTSLTPDVEKNFQLTSSVDFTTQQPMASDPSPVPEIAVNGSTLSPTMCLLNAEGSSSLDGPSAATTSPPTPTPDSASPRLIESDSCCDICGYRPKGDPRWFGGSMAKHKKLQHATTPPKIYRCPFPGCTSQYKNRSDNLRQHQLDKGHFVGGQEDSLGRSSKRKRIP